MRKPAHPGYEGLQRKKLLALLVTIALLLVAVVISAGTGSIKLTPWEVISTLFGGGDSLSRVALFEKSSAQDCRGHTRGRGAGHVGRGHAVRAE